MTLYRIVQQSSRTTDISGTGAFKAGGRWNSKGTYMLYTSENSSLAMLETLVHFDKSLAPPFLYIMQIDVDVSAPIFTLPDSEYPTNWLTLGLIANQHLGDRLMNENKYLGIRVRSAINIVEYNCLLNPLFPGYGGLVKVATVKELQMDGRLVD